MQALKAAAALPLLLSACAQLPPTSNEPPAAFHDTRLQYALVAGDDATLAKDFGMKLPPSWVERAAAGAVLPFTATTEAVFFPLSAGIKAFAPDRQR